MVEVAEMLLVNHGFPAFPTVPKRGRIETKGFGEVANQSNILELELGPAAGSEVTSHHAVPVQIQDAAFREATQQGFPDEGGIDAGEFGEAQGLCDGVDGLGDDELVGEFGDLSGA